MPVEGTGRGPRDPGPGTGTSRTGRHLCNLGVTAATPATRSSGAGRSTRSCSIPTTWRLATPYGSAGLSWTRRAVALRSSRSRCSRRSSCEGDRARRVAFAAPESWSGPGPPARGRTLCAAWLGAVCRQMHGLSQARHLLPVSGSDDSARLGCGRPARVRRRFRRSRARIQGAARRALRGGAWPTITTAGKAASGGPVPATGAPSGDTCRWLESWAGRGRRWGG